MKALFPAFFFMCIALTATSQKRNFTTDDLWKLNRLSGTVISPDGKLAFYQSTAYSIEENKGTSTGYLLDLSTGKSSVFFTAGTSFSNVIWDRSGNLLWLADGDKGTKLMSQKPGTDKSPREIAVIQGEPEGFTISPDGKYLAVLKPVKIRKSAVDNNPDLPKTSGKVFDDLMYRHWNAYQDENALHLFVYEKQGETYVQLRDVMENEAYPSVTPPFGGIDDVAFSADGRTVYYSTKKKSGKQFAVSTDSDIYAYTLGRDADVNLTAQSGKNKGYDTHPVISPDGKFLAYLSMATDGFESDKNRVIVRDLATGSEKDWTISTDLTAEHFAWHQDSRMIYFTAAVNGTKQVFEATSQKVRQLTSGRADIVGIQVAKNFLLAEKQSMVSPTDLWQVDLKTGTQKQLTFVNKELMEQIALPEVMEKWVTTTDGKKMLVWVIAPPNFDSNKKYPALLYCQGGPQSAVSQYFSYRWNFLLMASNGYVVMAPNRRGLPGFGQEWNDAISKDWGGQAMRDYLTCTDSVAALPFVDKNRLGAVGASYGGYSVYYLAGIHNNRFKAFISHCGLFNLESWYGTTEELFFANHDIGGPYWIPQNRELYAQNSPHLMVDKWNTPMLVIHGGKDFRVPESEGMQAFQVLQLKGIPSKMLYFPDEGHWVTKPQNSVLWHREFYKWLDSYLK